MTKTPILTGTEVCVTDLGGQNAAVLNLSKGTIWASAFPNVVEGADNVYEIPAGGGVVVLDARGTVYLLGTGKVQVTGTDYATPNFRQPSSSNGGGGGTSDVTKAYVDAQDSTTLGVAKTYTDTAVNAVKADVTENADDIVDLQTDMTAAQSAIITNSTAIATVQTAAESAQSAADSAQTTADTAQTAAETAQTTADSAQAAADTNAANITATAAATLKSANTYTDTKTSALDTRVAATETAITALNGTGTGSVTKAVADGIADVVAGAPESLDTLKEISDWISSHSDSAAAMNTQIQTNSTDISALQTAKADKSEIPKTLPANGGNAATVNGHTVAKDVPADAKFTDTTYTAATVAPKANGTAAVGTSAKYAREDHVHPAQTSVSGNAGTATKLQTARKINGVAFDGSADITVTAVDSTARTAASNAQTTANTNATNITSLQNGKFDKTGGTISGDVRIKSDANYGTKLNFGDGDYVYLHEDTDEHLVIHAGNGIAINAGDGLTIDGIKYPTQCLGRDTGFVYLPEHAVDVDNYKSETHRFLMNTINTPTSHGLIDVSYFDGSYFSPSSSGVIRQIWTDWGTGDVWVRVCREVDSIGVGTWTSWKKLT